MNGFPPPGMARPSLWKETKTEDGRSYYYNSETNVTTWDKPAELMTEKERALIGTSWKEYEQDGRPYWYNTETKLTTWEMPKEAQDNLARDRASRKGPALPAIPPGPAAWAAGPSSYMPSYNNQRDDNYRPERRDRERDHDRERDREGAYGGDRGPSTFGSSTEVLYSNPEEAEAAFMKLLKRIGAQSDWSWKQAVRAGIKDSQWRAIPDPKEREEAFKKYCEELRAQDKAKEQERQAKLRSEFMQMLGFHQEIKHYTRWKTALPIIEHEAVFREAKDDNERRALFDEYIISLKREHAEREREDKKSALDKLETLMQTLDLEPFTRWHEAEQKLEQNEEFHSEKYTPLHKIDLLTTFERHIKHLREDLNKRVQSERAARFRKERKNRDAFRDLLNELKASGKLKAGTKWKEIREHLHEDPRYLAMLGQDGSSPLDLFWDALEEEDGKFRQQRRYALEALEVQRFEVTTATPFEDFVGVMRTDTRTANIDEQSMHDIFNYIINKVKKREEDERRDSEYHERRAMDDLRSVIKHLEPPVLVTDTWEMVRPRVEKTEEFRAIKSDASRLAVFDKYIRRLKEKEKDREDRGRREPRDRERGGRRERDREYRNGSDTHRRHRTRTRSPEHDKHDPNDMYAAERRKAQQDREARYRNTDRTGLSPPYRRAREDDRYEPRSRQGSGDHYVRERREREVERERTYVSRADPRERSSELDYGGPPVSARRRRESDESAARRDNKRVRRSKSPAPAPAPEPVKEDPGLRSGSEEGEIEED